MSDEHSVEAYAAAKHFGEATLARWLAQTAADQAALLELAAHLRLGENQFRDLLDDLVAIGARRGCSIAAVVEDEALRAALGRSLGRNEAVKALKHATRRLRYPQLSVVEQRLGALARAVRLPAGVRLELPENLEGEHLAVTLRGRSAAELRLQAQAVAAALQSAPLEEMFALLEGEW